MRKRILLLGMGFWGQNWLSTINDNADCELAGIAGAVHELNAVVKEGKIEADKAFDDFKVAIEKTDAHIAVIVLPFQLHAEAAKLAVEKGMHIIMEKPMAVSADEADELVELKRKHPELKMMASQNYRWRSHNQFIKRSLDNNDIGVLDRIRVNFRQPEDLQGYRAGLEKPLLQDVCIHHFDLIRFFTNSECREVFCQTSRPAWSIFEGEPNVDAIIKMRNGIQVNYSGTWAARGDETSWDGEMFFECSEGCIHLRPDQSINIQLNNGKNSEIIPDVMENEEIAYSLAHMLDCVESDKEPETNFNDNAKSMMMYFTAEKSASLNQFVVIESGTSSD